MKSLRREFFPAFVVLALVGAIVAAFPFDAVDFQPAGMDGRDGAFAAFVSLDAGEEVAAMKAAKNSWNAEAGGVRRLRAELFAVDLPDDEREPALRFSERMAWGVPEPVEPGLSPYLPSRAAPPPAAIPDAGDDEKGDEKPAFPREDLLKME